MRILVVLVFGTFDLVELLTRIVIDHVYIFVEKPWYLARNSINSTFYLLPSTRSNGYEVTLFTRARINEKKSTGVVDFAGT